MSRLPVILGAAFGCFCVASRAAAQGACAPSDRPVVEILLEVEPPDRFIGQSLAEHLTAELRARDIDVCPAPASARMVIARVRLHVDHPEGGPVVAIIQIGDAITDKRVERTLNLSKIPPDARPLAVAASADELLRASWAELRVQGAPPPLMPVPSAVSRSVALSLDPPSAPPPPSPAPGRFELGLLASASSSFSDRSALGGAVLARAWVTPRLGAVAELGAEAGLARASAHGSVRADDLSAALGLTLALLARPATRGVDLEGGMSLLRVSFATSVDSGAVGGSASDWTALVRGGARGWVQLGSLRWTLGVAALVPVRPVRALDTGMTVTAVARAAAELSLGAFLPL